MKERVITDEILPLLRCPQTMQALSPASAEQLAEVEAARREGRLRDRGGRVVQEPVVAGLVREDGALLYPVREGLAILLMDEALALGEA